MRPGEEGEPAKQLLGENLDFDLQFYRVGRNVNAASRNKERNDSTDMIIPIAVS